VNSAKSSKIIALVGKLSGSTAMPALNKSFIAIPTENEQPSPIALAHIGSKEF
jgi:hypothetical protein